MNTTFTPFRSARWLLLFLLLSFSGSLDAWAHAYSPASYDAGNGSLPVAVAGDSKPALVPATQRFKGGSTVVADVVSLNRFTPLDQIIDPARWTSVKYEVQGIGGGGDKFRLTTTGTASGTITDTFFNEFLNTGYVTVGEISGVGTIRLDYQMDSGEWFAGQTYDIVDLKPTVLSTFRFPSESDSLSILSGSSFGDAEIIINFSEPVTGLDVADLNLVLDRNVHTTISAVRTVASAKGTGNAWYETYPNGWVVYLGRMRGVGSIGVELKPEATLTDTQGNAPEVFSTGPIYRYDGVEPFVTSIKRSDPASTVAVPGTVTYRVTFSEAVKGVDAPDFGFDATGSVAGYRISTITPVSASVYDVTVTGITGEGTLRLKLWPGFSYDDYSTLGLFASPLENMIFSQTQLNGGCAVIFDFSNGHPIPSPSTYVSTIPFGSDPLYTYDNPLTSEFIDGETYTISSTPVVASINPTTAGLSCANPTVRLTASAGTAYLWSTGATNAAIDVTTAGTYSVTVTNNGNTAVASAEVTGSTQAPAASINPGSATLNCTTPSVTLTASGGESYRWDDNSTNATRSVSTAGTYSVTVTGANGCTATATTIVTQSTDSPLALTSQPASASSVGVGATVTTSVALSGTSSRSFQWFKNDTNTPVANQTSATLSLTNVQLADAGRYFVVVTCPCNSVSSTSFTLTVNAPNTAPVATTNPNQTATVGTAFTYTVNAFTDPEGQPLTYSINGLPAGLSFDPATRVISGTPTTPGLSLVTVGARDPDNLSASSMFLFTVSAAPVVPPSNTAPSVANTIAPRSATVNQAFSFTIPVNTFTDAETPSNLMLSASGLPAGLILSGSTISGTPSLSGVSTITVTATDPGSLSVNTTFQLTVNPAPVIPPTTSPFSITGVTTVSCQTLSSSQREVRFTPQYAGLTGQPISFSVANELSPTTAPGPYTLWLYTDNPAITLRARQTGSTTTASFVYNWLAACNGNTPPPGNTPPRVVNTIPAQTATVGQGFTYILPATTFTDDQTPNALGLSVSGLPAGLVFTTPATISGTPSQTGVSSVTVTATDPGGLMTSTPFTITVSPASTSGTAPFSITRVTTVSCQTLSAGQREVRFTPQYAGLTGQPISFSVANELLPTTAPGPYTLRLYTDNPTITLRARQTGTVGEVSFTYNWLAACNSTNTAARLGAESPDLLQVTVLGNPVVEQSTQVEVRGAAGLPLQLVLTDVQGHTVAEKRVGQAGLVERVSLPLNHQPAGLLLLRVNTPTQSLVVKVIRQ